MGYKPVNCVWEFTLACDLRCGHCGSEAPSLRERGWHSSRRGPCDGDVHFILERRG